MALRSIGFHGRWDAERSEIRVLPASPSLLCDGIGLGDCTRRGLSAVPTAPASTTDGSDIPLY